MIRKDIRAIIIKEKRKVLYKPFIWLCWITRNKNNYIIKMVLTKSSYFNKGKDLLRFKGTSAHRRLRLFAGSASSWSCIALTISGLTCLGSNVNFMSRNTHNTTDRGPRFANPIMRFICLLLQNEFIIPCYSWMRSPFHVTIQLNDLIVLCCHSVVCLVSPSVCTNIYIHQSLWAPVGHPH